MRLERNGFWVAAATLAAIVAVSTSPRGVVAGDVDVDLDGDTVWDEIDNCVGVPNPSQRDDDLDGYGNICDADLNQDCVVGGADIGLVGQFWLQTPPWGPNPAGNGTIGAFDVNQENVIGGADIGQIAGNWLGPAGPSGFACSAWCNGTTQVAPPPASCP